MNINTKDIYFRLHSTSFIQQLKKKWTHFNICGFANYNCPHNTQFHHVIYNGTKSFKMNELNLFFVAHSHIRYQDKLLLSIFERKQTGTKTRKIGENSKQKIRIIKC